jgi:hypothetical protein
MTYIVILLLPVLLLLLSVSGLTVTNSEPEVRTKENKNYIVWCKADQELDFCTWYTSDYEPKCHTQADEPYKNCPFGDDGRFESSVKEKYYCVLSIKGATTKDPRMWTCRLRSGIEDVEKNINVKVYSKTKVSFSSETPTTFVEGEHSTFFIHY